MNERNLFRDKRLDNGEWCFGVPWEAVNGTEKLYMRCKTEIDGSIVQADIAVCHATIGQCTGLKDRTGALIFEGDILEVDNKYHPNKGYLTYTKILWDGVAWCESYIRKQDLPYNWTFDTSIKLFPPDIAKWAHVIGNIHDTPGGE